MGGIVNIEGFERTNGKANTLAVILHGWSVHRHDMRDVIEATREAYARGGGVDVYAPELAYSRRLSFVTVEQIILDLLVAVDAIVDAYGPYERIIMIGHSMGGVLARRMFLLAAGEPPDFRYERAFAGAAARPRRWAAQVQRLVTLGSFDRGWQASQRDGWKISFFYNLVGLLGHVMIRQPTIFGLRLGSPFIVQSRLHWLAFRRWRQSSEPLVVQILGNRDDSTSPLNQVDLAVDRPDDAVSANDQSYVYLEMRNSAHNHTIDFSGPERWHRREVFVAALTQSTGDLLSSPFRHDPRLLADDLPPIDANVNHAVFVMHGIRDDGYWTSRLAKHVKERAHVRLLKTRTPTYGYFAMLPFLLPWIRRQKVEWFMDQYVEARALFPNAALSFIGHSNGTYLAARALEDYAEARFKHVFFAGSVVRRDYPWAAVVADGRVAKFHNVRASFDWVVALLPKSVERLRAFDLGGAGWDGFDDTGKHPDVTESRYFANGKHSAALVETQWDNIANFVISGTVPLETPAEDFTCQQSRPLRKVAETHMSLPFIAIAALVLVPLSILFLRRPRPRIRSDARPRTLALTGYFALLKFIVTRV
jgi:pimeloyl-ACP methyl ester carboxylesterase